MSLQRGLPTHKPVQPIRPKSGSRSRISPTIRGTTPGGIQKKSPEYILRKHFNIKKPRTRKVSPKARPIKARPKSRSMSRSTPPVIRRSAPGRIQNKKNIISNKFPFENIFKLV